MDERTRENGHQIVESAYDKCTIAMKYMWINNIVTDKEYNDIMIRLNKKYNNIINKKTLSKGE